MSPTTLTATVAALAALALPTSGAEAGRSTRLAETCAGQTPTAVAVSSGGDEFEGTEGDDVILVTQDMVSGDSAIQVLAKGGDDLICVRVTGSMYIRAGDGHDLVSIQSLKTASGRSGAFHYIERPEDLDLDLRAGSVVELWALTAGTGRIDGGVGRRGTSLRVSSGTEKDKITIDLADQLLEAGEARYEVSNVDHVSASARKVVLTGDDGANRLGVDRQTCKAVLEGGKGDDVLRGAENSSFIARGDRGNGPYGCPRRRPRTLAGQAGDDTILGSIYRDLIIGGPGRDIANGGPDEDICRTVEVVRGKSCEKR